MTELWDSAPMLLIPSVSQSVSQSVSESVSDEPRYRAAIAAKNLNLNATCPTCMIQFYNSHFHHNRWRLMFDILAVSPGHFKRELDCNTDPCGHDRSERLWPQSCEN